MFRSVVNRVIGFSLSVLVIGLGWILSFNALIDREKNSPFECGFDPLKSARLPYSIRFFLLAIIFLIFDIEIVLLFPLLVSVSIIFRYKRILGCFWFLIILIIGLFYEWRDGSLDWVK